MTRLDAPAIAACTAQNQRARAAYYDEPAIVVGSVEERALDLYQDGHTLKQVSAFTGLSVSKVGRLAQAAGISRRGGRT